MGLDPGRYVLGGTQPKLRAGTEADSWKGPEQHRAGTVCIAEPLVDEYSPSAKSSSRFWIVSLPGKTDIGRVSGLTAAPTTAAGPKAAPDTGLPTLLHVPDDLYL